MPFVGETRHLRPVVGARLAAGVPGDDSPAGTEDAVVTLDGPPRSGAGGTKTVVTDEEETPTEVGGTGVVRTPILNPRFGYRVERVSTPPTE